MADAQGAFVTRSFEKLLKEATGKKHQKLHQALKAYLGEGEHSSRRSTGQGRGDA